MAALIQLPKGKQRRHLLLLTNETIGSSAENAVVGSKLVCLTESVDIGTCRALPTTCADPSSLVKHMVSSIDTKEATLAASTRGTLSVASHGSTIFGGAAARLGDLIVPLLNLSASEAVHTSMRRDALALLAIIVRPIPSCDVLS